MTSVVFALILPLLPARVSAQSAPAASPAPAASGDARPAAVDPRVLQKQADDLIKMVADQSTSLYRLHTQAAALFTNVQSETPLVRPDWTPVEREKVDGHVGTVAGMIATANQRFAEYRLRFREPPPPDVLASAQTAQNLQGQGRAIFDKTGRMAENQMGVFRYDRTKLDGGIVELNRRMALLATRIGEAFAYATLVHEATHARDRARGKLSPEHAIDGEIDAFRVQYLWLTTMDPTGMRLVVLRSTLNLWAQAHPKDVITPLAVRYLDHLLALWQTGGDKDKLREFVEKLGYEDDPDRPAPPAAKTAAPAPVRA